MKNFMKLVILSVSLFAGNAVFAQCVPMNGEYRNPYTGFVENAPRVFDSNLRCYVPQGTQSSNNQGVQILANQAIRIPVGGIPSGYCAWDERLKNVGLSTVLGGIFGALVGDNGRAAGQGAALGLLVGTAVPCAAQQQYLQGIGGQGQVVSGGNTRTVPSNCSIDGKPELQNLKGLSEAQCAEVARLAGTKVQSEPVRTSVSTGVSVSPENDLWKWRDGNATPSTPGKCVVARKTGEQTPSFCSTLIELPARSGETRSEWRIRAEKA